jgi:succinate dehydrogenase hydrophobic anchor subunit
MWEFLTAIVKKFEDPFVIMAFCIIGGLFLMLWKKEKNINDVNEALLENNLTMSKLVTLVEVLVYGRDRNGNP